MAERIVETLHGSVAVTLDRRDFQSGKDMITAAEKRAKAEAGSRKLVGTMGVKADGELVTMTFPLEKER